MKVALAEEARLPGEKEARVAKEAREVWEARVEVAGKAVPKH
jgi:hypothetical protein